MSFRTAGIHHVTGIASDPQRNLDFYAGILGLRLVKRTVNFDDPTTYHFYFGNEAGTPGSILTFFPWPDARRGRQGGGQVAVTSFSILPGSVGFWIERLIKKSVELRCVPGIWAGVMGAGTVHHVAFRSSDQAEQMRVRSELTHLGYNVTPQLDRDYFKSIYFREPGGVLFEIATDGPGFAVDESPDALGAQLRLPPWLESEREALTARLPRLRVPQPGPR